jgi:uncharacterized protein YecT (DUF1311 family)
MTNRNSSRSTFKQSMRVFDNRLKHAQEALLNAYSERLRSTCIVKDSRRAWNCFKSQDRRDVNVMLTNAQRRRVVTCPKEII